MSFKKINYFVGLERWLFQHLCRQVFVCFIITTICNFSSLGSIALFLHSQTPVCDWCTHMHSDSHAHQIKQIFSNFFTLSKHSYRLDMRLRMTSHFRLSCLYLPITMQLQPCVTMCSFHCGLGDWVKRFVHARWMLFRVYCVSSFIYVFWSLDSLFLSIDEQYSII